VYQVKGVFLLFFVCLLILLLLFFGCCCFLLNTLRVEFGKDDKQSQYVVVVVGDFFFFKIEIVKLFSVWEGIGFFLLFFFQKGPFFTKVHPPSPWQGLQ